MKIKHPREHDFIVRSETEFYVHIICTNCNGVMSISKAEYNINEEINIPVIIACGDVILENIL